MLPCCTLIAFLLSQIGIAVGAIKVRLSGVASIGRFVPAPISRFFSRRRWAGLAGAFAFEVFVAAAVAPYLFTHTGQLQAADSFAAAWHICSMGADRTTGVLRYISR